jgi:hypothetical protein
VCRVFLTAEWRNLVMLNFTVEPSVLEPFVPSGTVLAAWHGSTYLSLVGFLFADTRVLGIPIPGHRTFEEWLRWLPSNPPARQDAKLPVRIPSLEVSSPPIAED